MDFADCDNPRNSAYFFVISETIRVLCCTMIDLRYPPNYITAVMIVRSAERNSNYEMFFR